MEASPVTQPTMLIFKPSQTTLTGNTLLSRKSKIKRNHPTQLFLAHLTLDNRTCQPCREILPSRAIKTCFCTWLLVLLKIFSCPKSLRKSVPLLAPSPTPWMFSLE